jgi:hypothetical protein
MLRVGIRVKGHIDRDWLDALESLNIIHSADGASVLSGRLRDQAALDGLLAQLSSLGLRLVSLVGEDAD